MVLRPGGGVLHAYSGLYGEAPPKRGVFFKLTVCKRLGKIAILVYEASQNQLQSGRNAGQSEVYQRVPHFGRSDYATESEQLKYYCFGLSLRYKKGVQFCSRYMKGVPFW